MEGWVTTASQRCTAISGAAAVRKGGCGVKGRGRLELREGRNGHHRTGPRQGSNGAGKPMCCQWGRGAVQE